MNACKEYAAGRIWLQSKLRGRRGWRDKRGGVEGGMVYRWAWGGGVEGQDVCLPMSRDSERKRRGEWDERREEGDGRRREVGRKSIFAQRRNHVLIKQTITDILSWIVKPVNFAAGSICMCAFVEEMRHLQLQRKHTTLWACVGSGKTHRCDAWHQGRVGHTNKYDPRKKRKWTGGSFRKYGYTLFIHPAIFDKYWVINNI